LIAAWFDEIPAALWMVEGPEHRVVGMNRAARVSTGGQSAALGDSARKTASDFLDQARLARMDSVFASGHPMVEQDRSVTDRDAYGNPVELIVSVSIVPTRGSDGRVRGLVVQRLDVTQAARARQHAIEHVGRAGDTSGHLPGCACPPGTASAPVRPPVATGSTRCRWRGTGSLWSWAMCSGTAPRDRQ
jgi:hypothetical protein